jgi:hypothetical protein
MRLQVPFFLMYVFSSITTSLQLGLRLASVNEASSSELTTCSSNHQCTWRKPDHREDVVDAVKAEWRVGVIVGVKVVIIDAIVHLLLVVLSREQ